ncbi:MAG: head completion/stabilization protein [Desulfovibrionaceae bacterium]|jgi:hypothetical protein|nr:head completion/stabilization protein [Desulfovibrionaceae bacterium]
MPFVATANPPAAPAEETVANDGWWPDFDPREARAACRLDGAVTSERLIPALQSAMLSVNAELSAWQQAQRDLGYASAASVPPRLGAESAQVLRYRRAVHACLQADLMEAYRNMSTLPDGMNKDHRVLEALVVQIDEQRRQQRWAISDLLGIPRTTVELI